MGVEALKRRTRNAEHRTPNRKRLEADRCRPIAVSSPDPHRPVPPAALQAAFGNDLGACFSLAGARLELRAPRSRPALADSGAPDVVRPCWGSPSGRASLVQHTRGRAVFPHAPCRTRPFDRAGRSGGWAQTLNAQRLTLRLKGAKATLRAVSRALLTTEPGTANPTKADR